MRFSVCFFLILTFSFLFGQENRHPVKGAIPVTYPNNSSGITWAVVIGISDYQDSLIEDLHYADKDALVFAEYLRSKAGGNLDHHHLTLLVNEQAKAAQVAAAFDNLLEKVGNADQVIIYFSGHGDVEQKKISQPGYLLCYDSPSILYSAGGTVHVSDLQEIIISLSRQNKAKVVLISDACHSGKLSGNRLNGTLTTNSALMAQFANEVKILSCQPDEASVEGIQWGGGRGAFSYHLVEGLYGLADKNNDNKVSISEIDNYLEEHVTSEVAPQIQNPITQGNKAYTLSEVNPEILDKLQKFKRGELAQFEVISSRGFEEQVVEILDSFLRIKYTAFNKALKEKRLLPPADNHSTNYAENYYQSLIQEPSLAYLHKFMTRNYAAALQDEAQQAINAILKTNFQEISEMAIQKILKYHYFPRLLERAATLLGPSHYMYKIIKGRQLCFEGLLKYYKTYFSKDSISANEILGKFRESLNYNGQSPFTHYCLSLCFIQRLNQPDSAIAHVKLATDMAQSWILPYTHIAFLLSKNEYKRFNDAEILLQEAWQKDSNNLTVWMAYGGLKFYSKQFTEAEKWYLKIIEKDSHNLLARTNLGAVKIEQKKYKEAEEIFKNILKIDPNDFFTTFTFGRLYSIVENYSEAAEMYVKAISLNPIHIEAREKLCEIYLLQSKLKKAEIVYKEIVKLDPSKNVAWYNLACIAAIDGRDEEALSFLEQSLLLKKLDKSVLENEADFLSLKKSEKFIALMKKFYPSDVKKNK